MLMAKNHGSPERAKDSKPGVQPRVKADQKNLSPEGVKDGQQYGSRDLVFQSLVQKLIVFLHGFWPDIAGR